MVWPTTSAQSPTARVTKDVRFTMDDGYIRAEAGQGQAAVLGLLVGEFDDADARQVAIQHVVVGPHCQTAMR